MSASKNTPRRPVALIILDGFGVNPSKFNNAVAQAATPNLDRYFSQFPHAMLQSSGHAVGLPDGQMGNSEVGHLTLGCGEVIRQNLVLIDESIESGRFFENGALLSAVRNAADKKRPLHLYGLVSDGGVHSHLTHLLALIRLCAEHQVRPILHMITDGRDTPQQSALAFVHKVDDALKAAGGAIATIIGRYYGMDRDKRWERTELAWQAVTQGAGRRATSAVEAIESAYGANEYDEFIKPVILPGFEAVQAGDELLCFNFRKDRARQIIEALGCMNFSGFERGELGLARVTCMMPYDYSYNMPVAFYPDKPRTTLAEKVSEAGLKQFHCAETEKYAHVTYFFNGGRGEPHNGEVHHLIPSPDVATYDLQPEMSAAEVADATIEAMEQDEYSLLVVNFANGDMVGHTAVHRAVVKAVEALDTQVGRVLDAALRLNYSVVLTADHGNCEETRDPISGEPHTQHTTYPVPVMVIDEQMWQLSCNAGLANVAPTLLQIMGLEASGMEDHSLLLKAVKPRPAYEAIVGVA